MHACARGGRARRPCGRRIAKGRSRGSTSATSPSPSTQILAPPSLTGQAAISPGPAATSTESLTGAYAPDRIVVKYAPSAQAARAAEPRRAGQANPAKKPPARTCCGTCRRQPRRHAREAAPREERGVGSARLRGPHNLRVDPQRSRHHRAHRPEAGSRRSGTSTGPTASTPPRPGPTSPPTGRPAGQK